MCGGDWPPRFTLGGAIAAIRPPPSTTERSPWSLGGRLIFHDLGGRGSVVTHAMYISDSPLSAEGMFRLRVLEWVVKIHEDGDLTKPATESPVWVTISLKQIPIDRSDSVMYELEMPVKAEVGDYGIIGRRVSVWSRRGREPLSEGIAGFN